MTATARSRCARKLSRRAVSRGFYLDDRDGSGQWAVTSTAILCGSTNGSADLVTIASTQVLPTGAGTVSLGNASQYWNDVSYKTLTDRGCLGWYDDGVELQDGADRQRRGGAEGDQPHPYRRTPAGACVWTTAPCPKHVYRPAEIATEPVSIAATGRCSTAAARQLARMAQRPRR